VAVCDSLLCEGLTQSPFTVPANPPFIWEWPGASTKFPPNAFLQITVTDQAGNQAWTPVPSSPAFTQFTPGNLALSCGPQGQTGTTPCFSLEDPTTGDIPGDEPSQPENGETFSGYADPSMRVDPLPGPGSNGPANTYGTNLWMLYSWPLINLPVPTYPGNYPPAVETHLAYSPSSSGPNGGLNWTAWCTPFSSCDPGTTTLTPIWPSKLVGDGTSQYPYQYSSHEVPNFWPYINPATGAENWYAVHLMYFVQPPTDSIPLSIPGGCLVIGVAPTTPGNLAWAGSTQPYSCGDVQHFPTGSYPISFGELDQWANPTNPLTCSSWGEPAIMVTSVPTGTAAAYLAASCFSSTFVSQGYYIFTSGTLPPTSWSYFAGPFTYQNLPENSYPAETNSLTEFDWAQRADGSLVAVVSPEEVTPGSPNQQFGCVIVDFTLAPGMGGPFGSLVATVTDSVLASGTSPYEAQGPNACTYEPTSNTGVIIVRHLVNAQTQPLYTSYSLIETGIMP
jgi:hypothetical protein